MLTGVETAGLVLAAFPIVFHAIEGYKSGCEPLLDWWRFEKALSKMMINITTEEQFLQDHVRTLLNPIIDCENELEMLCNDLSHPLWRSQELERRLKDRLGNRYELYVETVNLMNDEMQEILCRLHARECEAGWVKGSDFSWRYQYRRVEICLRKKEINKLLDEAAAHRHALDKHLENTTRLGAPIRSRGTRLAKILSSIRDNACGLYSAICASWNCACPDSHTGHLLLQHRPEARLDLDAPIQFKVSFLIKLRANVDEFHMQELEIQSLQQEKIGLARHDVVASATRVRFQVATQTGQNGSAATQRLITSLCSTLKATRSDVNLGALRDQDGRYHIIKSCRCSSQSTSRSLICLNEALSSLRTTGRPPMFTLSRMDRTFLAMLTASSVLQLYQTPWLPTISKQDIRLFLIQGPEIGRSRLDVSRPMTFRTFQNSDNMTDTGLSQQSTADAPEANTREIMLRLAIILLELCFGETIEDRPFREQYYGPDKKPHRFTDLLTAKEWSDSVVGEAGFQYADVVKRCIDCNFGLVRIDLDDPDFRQVVYENVVEPLRETVERFSAELR